jgi:hypothetical protein
MIDQAFRPFASVIEELVSFRNELVDEQAGVRSYIDSCEIELPVELDVVHEGDRLQIGSTPPLYYVRTTFLPSFHRVRFTVQATERSDGD